MKFETFTYNADAGWSIDALPALDSERTLVLVFGGTEFIDDPTPIRELARAYPAAHFIGCSTAGEVLDASVTDHSLAVGVVKFEHTFLASAVVAVPTAGESYAAGEALAQKLSLPDLKSVFVLSDGLHVNGSELVRGLNAVLPESVIVTGGLAGDGARFERTWVLHNREPRSGFVSAIGFYGDNARAIRVGYGSKGGWDIFGIERRVTKSAGNVLYELDGKPALQLYKEYLGERAAGLPATALLFPLALRADRGATESVVRTVLAVDEAAQTMTFAGDIPQGYLAQLMRANFDRLVEGAADSATMAREICPPTAPALVIAISCVGRRLVLGELAEEELEATLEGFPPGTRQIGFYSYGELSPHAGGSCDLHNQTMTLTVISEG